MISDEPPGPPPLPALSAEPAEPVAPAIPTAHPDLGADPDLLPELVFSDPQPEISRRLSPATKPVLTGPRRGPATVHALASGIVPRKFGPAGTATPDPAIPVSESFQDLFHRVSTSSSSTPIVSELLSVGEVALWHGTPRSMKSVLLVRLLLDLAIGTTPAWGDPRFHIARPWRVMYFTEEDPAELLSHRIAGMLAGRAPAATFDDLPRDNFQLVVQRGLEFDSQEGRDTILREIRRRTPDIVAFDPLRGFSGKVDQGPAELRPVVRFLRYIRRETTAKTLILIHHDTKKPRDGKDSRSRPERASGGGIFSISDTPIAFERELGQSTTSDAVKTFCYPTGFKTRASPEPFSLTVDFAQPAIRFTCSPADEHAALDYRIMEFITMNPGCTVTLVRDGLGGDTHLISARLAILDLKGVITRVEGPRRARFHYLRGTEPAVSTTPPATHTTQRFGPKKLTPSSASGV